MKVTKYTALVESNFKILHYMKEISPIINLNPSAVYNHSLRLVLATVVRVRQKNKWITLTCVAAIELALPYFKCLKGIKI